MGLSSRFFQSPRLLEITANLDVEILEQRRIERSPSRLNGNERSRYSFLESPRNRCNELILESIFCGSADRFEQREPKAVDRIAVLRRS